MSAFGNRNITTARLQNSAINRSDCYEVQTNHIAAAALGEVVSVQEV